MRALFRRLRDEQHSNDWTLDLLTLSTLLETRGIAVLSSHEWQLPFLKEFISKDHQEQSDIFQQERKRLEKILEEG